ncbi:MAG: hypothetical protein V1913_05755 [Fibrobacterota bacterium]
MKVHACLAMALTLYAATGLSAQDIRAVNFSDERSHYAQFIGAGAGLSHTTNRYDKTLFPWSDGTGTVELHTQNVLCLSYEIMDDHIGLGGMAMLGFYDQRIDSVLFVPAITGYCSAYLYEENRNEPINPCAILALGVFPLVSPGVGLGCRFSLLQDFSIKVTGLFGWRAASATAQACYRFGVD